MLFGTGNCGPDNHWRCRTVRVNGWGMGVSTSVFAEADGTPHLAFIRAATRDLMYATFVGSGGNCGYSSTTSQFEWQCDTIDDDIGPVGAYRTVDIAADPSGAPMIAYHEEDSYHLQGNLKAMLLDLPLFEDGFETGDTGRWSSVQP